MKLFKSMLGGKPPRTKMAVAAEYGKKYSMTLREWLLNHQKNIVFSKCSWMGAKTLKNPLDAWIYQELIYSVKPDVIVEIGSYAGGSTLYFAHLLELMGHGMVISVDIDRTNYRVSHKRITAITGDSSSPEVFKQVEQLCRDRTVLVMHDGGHEKEQVARDLALYSKLVTLGSYFIVEDSIVDIFDEGDALGTTYAGPMGAILEFIADNKNFEIDDDCERYILTYNQKGFLKRIA
jgi:cephalosporin hydroxylase